LTISSLNDPQIYRVIGAGKTTAIFQLGTDLGKRICKKMKPSNFDELGILNALIRPAPIKAGKDDAYIRNRDNGVEEHRIKECNPILEETKGVLIFQEEIMLICERAAGFNMNQADTMRSLLGKKPSKLKKEQKKEKKLLSEKFIQGVIDKGYSNKEAEELLDELINFSKYCFNKSHSTAYARLIKITAYLKTRYPEIYMCAWLNHTSKSEDRIDYLNECKRLGITLLPPDINVSEKIFTLEGDGNSGKGIRFGLGFVKGVAGRADEIVKDRNENGKYQSLQKYLSRMTDIKNEKDKRIINSNHITALAKAGALDSFSPNRNMLLRYINYENINLRRKIYREIEVNTGHKIKHSKLFSGAAARNILIKIITAPISQFSVNQRTKYEIDLLGTYLPPRLFECLDEKQNFIYLPPIEKILISPNDVLFHTLGFIEEIGQAKRNRYSQIRVPVTITDPTGKLKTNLDVFKYRQVLKHLRVGNIISLLARTKIIKIKNEYIRVFYPERVEILG